MAETRTQARFDAAESIDELIGDTPLLSLDAVADDLYGKVDAQNPYSVKDRIAREIVDDAEAGGRLEPGGLVVESTSGNTGIGLAAVCAARGYELVLTMPESMSEERRALLRALGADPELTPAGEGMGGANRRAEAIADEWGGVLARQFETAATPAPTERPRDRRSGGPPTVRSTRSWPASIPRRRS